MPRQWRNLIGVAAMLALLLAGTSVSALDCPPLPEQSRPEWDSDIHLSVAHIGNVSGPELQARARSSTTDLLGRLPNADRVYLEQMLFASYCSAVRDDPQLSEAERSRRIGTYGATVRQTLSGAAPPVVPTVDGRDAARRALERLPVPYTGQAFLDSIERGRMPVIELFLKAGIDPETVDETGRTALMHAARAGQRSAVQALLQAGADSHASDGDGDTALSYAAFNGHIEVLKLLISRKPTAAAVQAALQGAAKYHQPESFELLFARLPLTPEQATHALLACLSHALAESGPAQRDAEGDAVAVIVRRLLAAHADPEASDDQGWSALAYASANAGMDGAVQALLDGHAVVDRRCTCQGYLEGDYTPLLLASFNRHWHTVDLLLAAGADIRALSGDGDTVLLHALRQRAPVDVIQRLLAAGADAGVRSRHGQTTLMIAVQERCAACVPVLLDHGVPLDARDAGGESALSLARQIDQPEERQAMVSLLSAGVRK